MTPIYIVAVVAAVGLVFGLLLSVASKYLAVETDPRVEEVADVLPKGQCGACGYAGCQGYAEAVVKNPDVPPNLCVPGKDAVAAAVAGLTGKAVARTEPRVASVRCAGTCDKAVHVYEYKGIQGCVSANMLHGGDKACKYGCLGFGTCVKSCPFGAMKLSPEGLPIVNAEKCTGCGKCQVVCPRGIIAMITPEAKVRVNCSSRDKGGDTRKFCSAGCVGCGACARNCPHGAIRIENNLAWVDASICVAACESPTCYAKCPTSAIKPVVFGVLPGTEDSEAPLPTRFDLKSVEQQERDEAASADRAARAAGRRGAGS